MKLPFNKEVGWTPLLFLVYVNFVFLQPLLDHAQAREWIITALGLAVFLPCYLAAFYRQRPGPLWYVAAIAILACVNMPFNSGSATYFIYAGSFLGFFLPPRTAMKALLVLLAVAGIEFHLLNVQVWYQLMIVLITAVVGLGNIHLSSERRANAKLKLAHAELEHLAKVAERERIARDLHDVLGHTLSVIVLKSELAAKLIERDAERARTELTQIEKIARDALGEVRQAIGGYRAASLVEEFARARETLTTAGVEAECDFKEPTEAQRRLTPPQEAILALIVREGVTNVVRHASARKCRLAMEDSAGGWRLLIEDDGRGGGKTEGNGLRGMRERVEALGGHMLRETARGTRLDIFIPQKQPREAIA